jgi:hypothetical protein
MPKPSPPRHLSTLPFVSLSDLLKCDCSVSKGILFMPKDCLLSAAGVTVVFLPLIQFAFLGCSGSQSHSAIGPGGRTTPADFFTDPGVRALADAAGTGDAKEIDRLVGSGVDVNAEGKDDGVTPLLWAMTARNHDGFLRLLERGADPNRPHNPADNRFGSSVMSAAARSKIDSFYLEAILKHGGNPNLVEPTGNRANREEQTTPLQTAAIYSRRVENLDLLIRAGADLNRKAGHFGSTPLTDAAAILWYEGVYRLLEAGADYEIGDDAGTSLADLAVSERVPCAPEVRKWKDKVLDFLEKKGVDLEAARRRAEARGVRTKKWTDEEWAQKSQGKGWPIPKE